MFQVVSSVPFGFPTKHLYAFFILQIRHLLESTALKMSNKAHKLFSLLLLHYIASTYSRRDTDLPLLIDQIHQNKKQGL